MEKKMLEWVFVLVSLVVMFAISDMYVQNKINKDRQFLVLNRMPVVDMGTHVRHAAQEATRGWKLSFCHSEFGIVVTHNGFEKLDSNNYVNIKILETRMIICFPKKEVGTKHYEEDQIVRVVDLGENGYLLK